LFAEENPRVSDPDDLAEEPVPHVLPDLPDQRQVRRSNALKNVFLGIADVTCCVVFILFWPVDWAAAVPMAIGVLTGSMIGPSLTRRVPRHGLRIIASLAGLGLAIHLWAGSYRA